MSAKIISPIFCFDEDKTLKFSEFIIKHYGHKIWSELCQININGQSLIDLVLEFGDFLFEDVAYLASDLAGISKDTLVEEFNKSTQTIK